MNREVIDDDLPSDEDMAHMEQLLDLEATLIELDSPYLCEAVEVIGNEIDSILADSLAQSFEDDDQE